RSLVSASDFQGLLVNRREDFRFGLHRAQGLGESQCLALFPMNDRDLFDLAGYGLNVARQFILVRVGGKGVQGADAGTDGVRFAENVDWAAPSQDLRPERMLGTITDEKDQV